jgi:hypothetical protein
MLVAPVSSGETATPETIKGVEKFLKTPVNELPTESIEGFLRVDPNTLPAKLQDKYKARRIELYTLKQLAEGKKKGLMRMMDKTCNIPEETKGGSGGVYQAAGYNEIDGSEVDCASKRTGCSTQEMMCEFTLRLVIETDPKGKKKYRWFLNPRDPLMAIVTACRGGTGDNSNFFGGMTASCTH